MLYQLLPDWWRDSSPHHIVYINSIIYKTTCSFCDNHESFFLSLDHSLIENGLLPTLGKKCRGSNIDKKFREDTLWMVKLGCRCLKPSNGAREQLVTNFISVQRSFGSNSLMTWSRANSKKSIIATLNVKILYNKYQELELETNFRKRACIFIENFRIQTHILDIFVGKKIIRLCRLNWDLRNCWRKGGRKNLDTIYKYEIICV